tara:strand:- start:8731 stop:8967 length:237 start_codon:yes stop_codon:yes gene_type:complete
MMENSFEFSKRNTNHWDVYSGTDRLFRIRGGGENSLDEKDFVIIGENGCSNATPNGWLMFKTLTSATGWITDYLMQGE